VSRVGCVLVHGYSGAPAELAPLAAPLAVAVGPEAVRTVSLPGHGAARFPEFDAAACVSAVKDAAAAFADRELVLVGHSTGGSVALAAAAALPRPPALVVLAATPPRIDGSYAARWARHAGDLGPELDPIVPLVSFVNRLARSEALLPFPLLVLNGEADALVPAAEAELWRRRAAAVRIVRLAGGGHDLFRGPAGAAAADVVVRAARDVLRAEDPHADVAVASAHVPELAQALARWPARALHLRESPAGRALEGRSPELGDLARAEPTLLNLSVTTRCNLACRACARGTVRPAPRDLSVGEFERILDHLPHALRVVLVGLGEPLLHPHVVELVRRGAAAGRRVSLVTNGTLLDAGLARALLDAGLRGLTVSLDAATDEGVRRTRRGASVATVLANLREFLACRERAGLREAVPTSVFTALAADTVSELDRIVDAVAPLGVDALLLSDLNFPENQERSLHRGLSTAAAARLDGTLRQALVRGLPILSIHALEELGVPARFREFLLLRGAAAGARATRHEHCRSPWQSLPVGPDGEATLCDCQPTVRLGNVLREPLSSIWNGDVARTHRRRMRSAEPPPACRGCPRF
jgi:MoaA/NifB/PqqE/SkfB family radical SAM enzyme/pimeloyl-ACP methyl ester carboxylesterase